MRNRIRSLATSPPGPPVRAPYNHLWQTSAVVAAWAIAAARPHNAGTTNWLSHVSHLAQKAQEHDDHGGKGADMLRAVYKNLMDERTTGNDILDH